MGFATKGGGGGGGGDKGRGGGGGAKGRGPSGGGTKGRDTSSPDQSSADSGAGQQASADSSADQQASADSSAAQQASAGAQFGGAAADASPIGGAGQSADVTAGQQGGADAGQIGGAGQPTDVWTGAAGAGADPAEQDRIASLGYTGGLTTGARVGDSLSGVGLDTAGWGRGASTGFDTAGTAAFRPGALGGGGGGVGIGVPASTADILAASSGDVLGQQDTLAPDPGPAPPMDQSSTTDSRYITGTTSPTVAASQGSMISPDLQRQIDESAREDAASEELFGTPTYGPGTQLPGIGPGAPAPTYDPQPSREQDQYAELGMPDYLTQVAQKDQEQAPRPIPGGVGATEAVVPETKAPTQYNYDLGAMNQQINQVLGDPTRTVLGDLANPPPNSGFAGYPPGNLNMGGDPRLTAPGGSGLPNAPLPATGRWDFGGPATGQWGAPSQGFTLPGAPTFESVTRNPPAEWNMNFPSGGSLYSPTLAGIQQQIGPDPRTQDLTLEGTGGVVPPQTTNYLPWDLGPKPPPSDTGSQYGPNYTLGAELASEMAATPPRNQTLVGSRYDVGAAPGTGLPLSPQEQIDRRYPQTSDGGNIPLPTPRPDTAPGPTVPGPDTQPTTPGLPPGGDGGGGGGTPPGGGAPSDVLAGTQIAGPDPTGGFERQRPPPPPGEGGGGLPPAPQVVNAMLSNASPALQQAASGLSPQQQTQVSQFAFGLMNQYKQFLESQGGVADPGSAQWQQQILPQIQQQTQQFVLQLTGRQNPQAVSQILGRAA